MTLKVESFDNAAALVTFVNTNSIPKADITAIRTLAGRWYLLYWS